MKKFKVTFFNFKTFQKRVLKFYFTWDYINHCWNIKIESSFGANERVYYGNPEELIENCEKYDKRANEYVTVKCFT